MLAEPLEVLNPSTKRQISALTAARSHRYQQQYLDFCGENFPKRSAIADAPVRAFLLYCVDRPIIHDARNKLVQGPICAGLDKVLSAISQLYTDQGLPSPVTPMTWRFLNELWRDYRPPISRAAALSLEDVKEICALVDTSEDEGLRFHAHFSTMFWAAGRFSELRDLWFPRDYTKDSRGVLLTVKCSKTNPTQRPEILPIPHVKKRAICAACSLERWVQRLGPDYVGRLFPSIYAGEIIPERAVCREAFVNMLCALARSAQLRNAHRMAARSTRRGMATELAAQGASLDTIRRALRQSGFGHTFAYIESTAIDMRLLSRALDPT